MTASKTLSSTDQKNKKSNAHYQNEVLKGAASHSEKKPHAPVTHLKSEVHKKKEEPQEHSKSNSHHAKGKTAEENPIIHEGKKLINTLTGKNQEEEESKLFKDKKAKGIESHQDIKDLFLEELHGIYSAEEQLVKFLPELIQGADFPELQEAFALHLQETKEQVARIKKIFGISKVAPAGRNSSMEEIVDECREVLQNYEKSITRDAALIAKAQKIEHYEVAAYTTLCSLAKELDLHTIKDLLKETLDEENKAVRKLNKIAEGGFLSSGINHQATEVRIQNPVT